MRIEGPGRTEQVKKSEKARKSSGASSFGSLIETDEAEGASETRGAAPMAGVGSLLAAQSVEDPAEGKKRKRMMARADKVLDALSGVHSGLLNGTLSVADMTNVNASLAANREKVTDPRLLGLLDEVDLRAQVELAKLEMARDKNKR